jgi:hypothetical protein
MLEEVASFQAVRSLAKKSLTQVVQTMLQVVPVDERVLGVGE